LVNRSFDHSRLYFVYNMAIKTKFPVSVEFFIIFKTL
jgi:hypothetical protein